MFGIDTTELLLVAVLALLFIGPKELPTAMRTLGRWVGKVRATARHFTSGFETLVREAELEEMEKKWREENDRIMREYPALDEPVTHIDPTDGTVTYATATEEQPPLPLEQPHRELP